MIVFPPAKINLGLYVSGKRPDGFHSIETIMVPIPLCDVLEIVEAIDGEDEFTVTGLEVPGNSVENLCLRALHLLRKIHPIPPVRIFLHKVIPMGSGLGGGSSDGAHTLMLLRDMFGVDVTTESLSELAARLGSDAPFFIQGVPALATGRGEILTPVDLNLKGLTLMLVVPPVHVSTREAYAQVVPSGKAIPRTGWMAEPLRNWNLMIGNDFEPVVFQRYPEVRAIRDGLYASGADFAAMTGSGSAVYGLFYHPPVVHPDFPGCRRFSFTL